VATLSTFQVGVKWLSRFNLTVFLLIECPPPRSLGFFPLSISLSPHRPKHRLVKASQRSVSLISSLICTPRASQAAYVGQSVEAITRSVRKNCIAITQAGAKPSAATMKRGVSNAQRKSKAQLAESRTSSPSASSS
jgi:hypothetical protein